MEGETAMIEIQCSCGGTFEVLNEQVAERVRCPRCGAKASDLIAAAGGAPTDEPAPEQFQVPCAIHPDQAATHNCMHCGKPLCKECVRERGYYCSDECREEVRAAEPDASPQAGGDMGPSVEKMERTMELVGLWIKRVAILALLAGLGYLGFTTYQRMTAPKGQVVAKFSSPSLVQFFSARLLKPDLAVVTANDELSLVRLSSGQKQWTVSLPTLEEKPTPPTRAKAGGEEFQVADFEYHDALRLAEVHGDHVLVRSGRQIIDFDPQTGAPRWKFFDPEASIRELVVHENGVWCAVDYSQHFINLSLADGTKTCTYSNQHVLCSIPIGNSIAVVAEIPKPAPTQPEDKEELTAGSLTTFDAKAVMAAALGKAVPTTLKTADYQVQLVSPADGHVIGGEKISVTGYPKLEAFGDSLIVSGDGELASFGEDGNLKWKATLSGRAREIAAGGEIVVATSEQAIVAFDAKSGKQKWTRTGLKSTNVVVGPDGGVYLTLSLEKNEVQQGEAKNYHLADIVRGGMGRPQPPFRALAKLDAQTGKTRWGIRNIGQKLFFDADKVFVVDHLEQTSLLANQIMVGGHAVHCLAARSGKELWSYVKTGDLYECAEAGGKVFIVMAEDPPSGRNQVTCNYQLQSIAAK